MKLRPFTRCEHVFAALVVAQIFAAVARGQTLTLTGPATARPGQTISVNVSLSGTAPDLAAMQWSLGLPTGYTVSKATAGAASTAAGKTLYCNAAWVNCLAVGINANLYAPGVVATHLVTVPLGATLGSATITIPGAAPLIGVVGATLVGGAAPLTVGPAYAFNVLAPTDINGDGKTDIMDLQFMIQEILIGPLANDQNGDGVGNVRDVQTVAKAATL